MKCYIIIANCDILILLLLAFNLSSFAPTDLSQRRRGAKKVPGNFILCCLCVSARDFIRENVGIRFITPAPVVF